MKLAILKKASPIIDKAKFLASKHSPEIWLGAGIVAIVGGTIWACHASRKLDEIMDDRDDKIDYLDHLVDLDNEEKEDAAKDGKDLSDSDLMMPMAEYHKQRAIATIQCAGELARAYAPSVILIGGGIAMVINGHRILNKRNAALLSAYWTLDDAFQKYRKRVSDRYGETIEADIYNGREYDTITVTDIDENGKKKKSKEDILVKQDSISPYLDWYSQETSREWTTSSTFNHTFLVAQQNAANDLLRVRAANMSKKGKPGWVFLNEVRAMLGMDQTPTGAICGWLLDMAHGSDPDGDNYIDFRMTEGDEDGSVMLDFNCEGMIYDQI